jgi:hypothetical protein
MPKIKTERAWLASTDPASLLVTLGSKRMPRKRRLIAVACCRRVLDQMPGPESRLAVEVGERFADGEATPVELLQAYQLAQQVAMARLEHCRHLSGVDQATCWTIWRLVYAAQQCCAASKADQAVTDLIMYALRLGRDEERQAGVAMSELIRDIVGNPFRLSAVDPAWRTVDVNGLAHAAYQERTLPSGTLDPARLAVLADALEEAGCTSTDLLSHCRDGGVHVRGCWVLDLLLAKG